jgi:hypothetical protein
MKIFSNIFQIIFVLSKIKENRRKQEICNNVFWPKNSIIGMDMFRILREKQGL